MIGDISVKTNLYLVSGYTDMRRSIDGLCATIQNMLHTEPDSMSVYLFCGKRCDRIKILIKEPDGMCLLYKRLDCSIQGRFRWPRNRDEVKPITWKQFDWLMSGLEVVCSSDLGIENGCIIPAAGFRKPLVLLDIFYILWYH